MAMRPPVREISELQGVIGGEVDYLEMRAGKRVK
jgi:hypothetical protein